MHVLLTKEASAHRLIVAAVQMCARQDDSLAIHVVACAALSITRELIKKRGDTYGNRAFRALLFLAAVKKQEGINLFEFQDAELDSLVDSIGEGITNGYIHCPEDIPGHMSSHTENELMRHITAPFNFLKHADRDADGHLSEDEVEPRLATMHAISAFAMLFPETPLPPDVESFLKDQSVMAE